MATPAWNVSGQSTTKRAIATSSVPAFPASWPCGRRRATASSRWRFRSTRDVRRRVARRPRLHRPRPDAGGDGQGKLVGRPRRRRARHRRAARRHHGDRQRRGRRPDGRAVGPRREVPRRRVGADHLRSPGRQMVRHGGELRRHGGRGRHGPQPRRRAALLDNTGHPAADTFALAHASKSHVHALGLRGTT